MPLSNDLTNARKHLSMVRAAHAHLGAGGRLANASRIRDAESVVEALETLSAIEARDGGLWDDFGTFHPVQS